MSVKLVCYGVRPNEKEFFERLNQHNYELLLIEDLLTHDNVETAKGMDAVLLRGNCVADRKNLEKFASYGVKYVLTRTVGFNHIDLKTADELNLKVARVPSYSPNAIAELSLTLAMTLLREVSYITNRTSKKNFRVDKKMFSREIRNCTVGILGVGKIGLTEAKLFKGLGANVIGYDIYHSEEAKKEITFKELDEVLAESDIISIHIPYLPGKTEGLINAEFIQKMKDQAIIINTARGELQDNQAILDALLANKLGGFATDVFANESTIFFRKFDKEHPMQDSVVEALIDLYPKVLVTPHIGSNTDEALTNMIETSYQNLQDLILDGKTDNEVVFSE